MPGSLVINAMKTRYEVISFLYPGRPEEKAFAGFMLRDHYTNDVDVRHLFDLGDFFCLGTTLKYNPEGNAADINCSIVQRRDRCRDWNDVKPRIYEGDDLWNDMMRGEDRLGNTPGMFIFKWNGSDWHIWDGKYWREANKCSAESKFGFDHGR